MVSILQRIENYNQISLNLGQYKDNEIGLLLSAAKPFHEGAGGSSAIATVNGNDIFVKKIALTDLELLPENIQSTANLFDLPLNYQYRLGSAGFGAWRELAAQLETNSWVLSGACSHFPLLYHWRVVNFEPQIRGATELTDALLTGTELSVRSWDNSQAIRRRIEALRRATSYLLLFLEYLPQTLSSWLIAQLKVGGDTADLAVRKVDDRIQTLTAFLNAQDFVHFDLHFENILCHDDIFLGDFGLALSSQFALTAMDRTFLEEHRNYDRCVAITSLIQTLMIYFFAGENWRKSLPEFLNHEPAYSGRVSPYISKTIERYAAVAQALSRFYESIICESNQWPILRL